VNGQPLRVPAVSPPLRPLRAEVAAVSPEALLRERQGVSEGGHASVAATCDAQAALERASRAHREVIDEGGRSVAAHFKEAEEAVADLKAQRAALQEQVVSASIPTGG